MAQMGQPEPGDPRLSVPVPVRPSVWAQFPRISHWPGACSRCVLGVLTTRFAPGCRVSPSQKMVIYVGIFESVTCVGV